MTQVATAAALGVTDRTIRNWAKAKSFQSALQRARERAEREAARAAAKERGRRERNARRRFRRQNPGLYSALTLAIRFSTDSLASPKSITVFGSTYSSLSIPAKPGLIPRFSTTMCAARSTSRIGMP
jgi:hypothetical protein